MTARGGEAGNTSPNSALGVVAPGANRGGCCFELAALPEAVRVRWCPQGALVSAAALPCEGLCGPGPLASGALAEPPPAGAPPGSRLGARGGGNAQKRSL